MGLILDSSLLITGERQGKNARQMLSAIAAAAGDDDVGISVITLLELAHGAAIDGDDFLRTGDGDLAHESSPQRHKEHKENTKDTNKE